MVLKNKLESEVKNIGMEVPFHSEIKEGYKVAKAAHIHSQECKRRREIRNKKFNKVRVLYWNLMFLLGGITLVSVGRILYDVIRIIKKM